MKYTREYNQIIKCKKCNSNDIMISEKIITHYNYWAFDNYNIVNLSEGCCYIKLIGECLKCKHKWNYKNIKTIDELKDRIIKNMN